MVSTSWFSGKKFEHGRFSEGALKLAPLIHLMTTKRNEATAEHLASWRVAALNADRELYQEVAVSEITSKFAERFAYENAGRSGLVDSLAEAARSSNLRREQVAGDGTGELHVRGVPLAHHCEDIRKKFLRVAVIAPRQRPRLDFEVVEGLGRNRMNAA
jgi:hypothetical protein